MTEEKKLTAEEIRKIALGFKWSPEMTYEEFSEKNSHVVLASRWELFQKIESRYIDFKYENK